MNEGNKDTLDLVSKSLRYENGKYQVQISWKKEPHLTNNYQIALNWLDNTDRSLIKQSELGEKYCEIIEQDIKKGYLEYVDVKNDSNDCWYLPHFSPFHAQYVSQHHAKKTRMSIHSNKDDSMDSVKTCD